MEAANFVVDDLLALPYDDDDDVEGGGEAAARDGGEAPTFLQPALGNLNFSADSSTVTTLEDGCSNSFSALAAGGDIPREFCFCEPDDELAAELEWVSNYIGEGDQTFAAEDLQKLKLISPAVNVPPAPMAPAAEASATALSASAAQSRMILPEAPVPTKARSKRSHASPTPASPTASAESGISAQAFPAKKASKKKAASAQGRRCLHCETDKTPQWRPGPMGPKTLCNACGVRYKKAGRLMPEYRPVASPTFVMSRHSNLHRKVLILEKRRLQQQPHVIAGGGIDGLFGRLPSSPATTF